jgi:hypothetical protein
MLDAEASPTTSQNPPPSQKRKAKGRAASLPSRLIALRYRAGAELLPADELQVDMLR